MTSDQFAGANVPVPTPYAQAPRPVSDENRMQRRLSLVTVALGAYLSYFAFSGQIYVAMMGRGIPGGYGALLVIQALIALGVLMLGWAFAPTTAVRRVAAAVLSLVLVVIGFGVALLRLSGAPFGPGGVPVSLTIGSVPFMLVVAVALGWLIVRERSPLAYIFVLLAGVVPFAQFTLLIQGVESGVSQLVLMALSALVIVVIAWVGRAVTGSAER